MSDEVIKVVENEEDKSAEGGREECELVELGLVTKDTQGIGLIGFDGGSGWHF